MKTIQKILNTDSSKFVLWSFIPVIVSTVAVFLLNPDDIFWLRMIWNYFLAVIPVYMALLAQNFTSENRKIPALIPAIGWLLFFPNSPYMLTDFKYLSSFDSDLWLVFNEVSVNVRVWVLLANLVISITLGILAGLISLDIIHKLLKNKFNHKNCWLVITAISILSSFGVYIGRFARLNSWDIINPVKIIMDTISVMTPFAIIYIAIFTVLTLFLYVLYKYIKYHLK